MEVVKRQLIIGMGSGRCGTMSLTHLLNAQPNAKITHEYFVPMPWKVCYRHFNVFLDLLTSKMDQFYYGDVSYWHLPYVKLWVSVCPDVKFICLKRNKQDVVNSYLRVVKLMKTCPVMHEHSKHWKPEWSHALLGGGPQSFRLSLPQYDLPIEEAYGKYWEDYYIIAGKWASMYPDNFRIYDMDYVLNTEEGQNDLFDFVNMHSRFIFPQIKANTSDSLEIAEEVLRRKNDDSS